MKSTQLQLCLLVLIAVSWKFEGAYTIQENDEHLIKKSENLILSPSIADNIREKRQDSTSTTPKPRKPRPYNIFKLASILATETKDETRQAINQIGALINAQFANGTTTTTPAPSTETQGNSTAESENGDNEITTTTEPFRITREEFLNVLRSNLQGIARLLRKEVKIALADSSKNAKEFGRDLGLAFRPLVYGEH